MLDHARGIIFCFPNFPNSISSIPHFREKTCWPCKWLTEKTKGWGGKRVSVNKSPKEHKCILYVTYIMFSIYEKENIPCLHLIHNTELKMMYNMLTRICAISNLLCLVTIQAWQLDFEILPMGALAKSAETPYAEIADSQRSTTSCCVSWMKNL